MGLGECGGGGEVVRGQAAGFEMGKLGGGGWRLDDYRMAGTRRKVKLLGRKSEAHQNKRVIRGTER